MRPRAEQDDETEAGDAETDGVACNELDTGGVEDGVSSLGDGGRTEARLTASRGDCFGRPPGD